MAEGLALSSQPEPRVISYARVRSLIATEPAETGGEASPGKSPAKGFIDGMIERKRLADEISEIDKDTEEATVSALAVAKQARGVAYLRS